MFHISIINVTAGETPPRGWEHEGGWTTKRSFEALARRLLHAMMTQDTFTVVMGGHSAAAGHGNHFSQSYMMQFHHVMEPIFERLGVKLITRNMAQGGLGTIQNALGAMSIYGDEIDVIIWDSHMTEGGGADFDLFCRQALLGSKRAPFILGLGAEFPVLQMLHNNAGADVGGVGSGRIGVPITQDEVQVNTLPWAAQYLACAPDRNDLCSNPANKYRTKCWIERDDVTPPTPQRAHADSQVSWHPGFREHQLTGRVLAFWMLQALDQALEKWVEITIVEGDPLADEYWHISDHYERIKQNVLQMPPSFCEDGSGGRFPSRVCRLALKARTEYTPRADPDKTSIRSILKPAPDGYIPSFEESPLYEGDDVPNPATMVPEGAVDVRSIVSKRRRVIRNLSSEASTEEPSMPQIHSTESKSIRRRADEAIVPGRGWGVYGEPLGFCDGTPNSVCGRQRSNNCLLYGHNDGRGGIHGDGLSGWLVMNLEGVKEGIVIMNIDFWHGVVPRTEGWTQVNDGKRQLSGVTDSFSNYDSVEGIAEEEHHRALGRPIYPPESLIFDYAINGKITTLTQPELLEKMKLAQRVVQLLTILDDEEMAKSGQVQNIELAIRFRGCERNCDITVNHVYWA